MPVFVSGLDLSRRFFQEVVRPLLSSAFPTVRYAAALLGPGSEVLGFDTEMSVDHDWGPRLFVFLAEADAERGEAIGNLLSQRLPQTFAGYPVSFPTPVAPRTVIERMIRPLTGPVKHRVIPITVRNFVRVQLGYDLAQSLEAAQQVGTWNERSLALAQAYEVLARLQNELQVSRTLPATVARFYDRPFPVISGGRFTQALVEQIADPAVRRIAAQRIIGNINQWSDNTDMEGVAREKLRQLYA
jgi:hypothetical protein